MILTETMWSHGTKKMIFIEIQLEGGRKKEQFVSFDIHASLFLEVIFLFFISACWNWTDLSNSGLNVTFSTKYVNLCH